MTKKSKRPDMLGNKQAYKDFDWAYVDDLLRIGCTEEEIATVIKVNPNLLNVRCKELHGMTFQEYIKMGLTDYKISLKRAQTRSAIGIPLNKQIGDKEVQVGWVQQPNVTMQIWLGKNHLGQKDHTESTIEMSLFNGFDKKKVEEVVENLQDAVQPK